MTTVTRQGPTEVLRIKAAVRERDGYCCTECGLSNDEHFARHGKSLHVHRKKPGSRYSLRGCVSLCFACHGPKPRRPQGSMKKVGTVYVRIDPVVGNALDAHVKSIQPKTTETAVVEMALRQYLQGLGLLPRP